MALHPVDERDFKSGLITKVNLTNDGARWPGDPTAPDLPRFVAVETHILDGCFRDELLRVMV
ncbi:hypothetical protein BFJ69_g8544 [Fusarium oxysporum]|uniref:Uncharacterized protein n=1 Tax=Fusarium oxysporum TaxID=5507 RepID=A0A420N2F6_FUSOX|nr:hypothetical protein BFJ69_g8544 [Fusarium oxysporum]